MLATIGLDGLTKLLTTEMNDIIIDYKVLNDNSWKRLVLNPRDYFDEQDSDFSIDSIEKYYLEPRNYIPVEKGAIQLLNFDISDNFGNRHLMKFTYWNNGSNQILDSIEYKNEKLIYRTIVQSVMLTNRENLLLRLEEINGQLIPLTHSIRDNEEEIVQENDLSTFKDFRKGTK
jgi:hypothetical protein